MNYSARLNSKKKFTKNEILQIYVNTIFFGNGIYGIEGASQFYFGKDASELNIAEASLLIGMNRAPEIYSPVKSIDKAKIVQKIVLNQFVKAGFLTKENSKMEFDRFWNRFSANGVLGSQSFWKTDVNRSGYVTEFVRQALENEFMKDFLKEYNEESSRKFCYEKITQGGLIIETTIDINKQVLAEKVVKEQLKYIKAKIVKKAQESKLEGYKETDVDKLESSFSSIDYTSGEVLALVGGSGYSFANQLNRALYSYRQIWFFSKAPDLLCCIE